MSEQERYVDPNSGAAPQPGSFAGQEAAAKGFGPPPTAADGTGALEEEVVPSAYEDPSPPSNPTPTASEAFGLAEPDEDDEDDLDEDEDEDEDALPPELQSDGAGEAQAVADAAVEHQGTTTVEDIVGINPPSEGVEVAPDGTESDPIEGDGSGEPLPDAGQDPGDFPAGNSRAPHGAPEVVEEEPEPEVKDYTDLLSGNLDDVKAYVEAHPDEKEAVQAAEAAGEGRKGVASL